MTISAPSPELACVGKVTHATASGAYEARKRQVNRNRFIRRKGLSLVVYRCPHCTGWHIGNTGKA